MNAVALASVDVSAVNAPVFGVLPPIAVGDANPPVPPVPPMAIGSVLLYVVALPDDVMSPVRLALVVAVSDNTDLATYKLGTRVVDVMTRGAVPIATFEVN